MATGKNILAAFNPGIYHYLFGNEFFFCLGWNFRRLMFQYRLGVAGWTQVAAIANDNRGVQLCRFSRGIDRNLFGAGFSG